jgi:hypothetical protein
MRKLIPLLAAGALSLGALLATPDQAAAQAMPVHWGQGYGYGGGYYAPPPPPPPPYYGRPWWHRREWGGPPPWAYTPPRPHYGSGYYRY